ncbi:MAG: hypothetical protein NVS2B16_04180 [Chloroflexota bacterium]
MYGTLAFLIRLRRDFDARHMVAAFDTPMIPTFRHELYPAYQGQRGPLGGDRAHEFLRQVSIATTLFPALGVQAIGRAGYEADDIMGTLACRARDSGARATVVSTDRDVLQLVGGGVRVCVPGSKLVLYDDDTAVRTRLGVAANGVTSWKALSGDASDNIPGVRGVGAKSASALVNEYGDLDGVYAHIEDVAPRLRSLLASGREAAYLFLKVVTIVTDLDLADAFSAIDEVNFQPSDRVRALLDSVPA